MSSDRLVFYQVIFQEAFTFPNDKSEILHVRWNLNLGKFIRLNVTL